MKTYTGFCRESGDMDEITIWIQSFEVPNDWGLGSVVTRAQVLCAEAWDYEIDDIHVLGIAEGNVKILHWEDL